MCNEMQALQGMQLIGCTFEISYGFPLTFPIFFPCPVHARAFWML